MNYSDNKAADENFENLRKQYAEGVQLIRDVCDESMDVKTFLRQTEDHIRKAVTASEDGLRYLISSSWVLVSTYDFNVYLPIFKNPSFFDTITSASTSVGVPTL